MIDDVDAFDAALFGISAGEAEALDPRQRLLLECAYRGLEHAGYTGSPLCARAGLFAGVSVNTCLLTQLLPLSSGLPVRGAELPLLTASDKDFAPTRISYRLDLRGPSVGVQTSFERSTLPVTGPLDSMPLYAPLAVFGSTLFTSHPLCRSDRG